MQAMWKEEVRTRLRWFLNEPAFLSEQEKLATRKPPSRETERLSVSLILYFCEVKAGLDPTLDLQSTSHRLVVIDGNRTRLNIRFDFHGYFLLSLKFCS